MRLLSRSPSRRLSGRTWAQPLISRMSTDASLSTVARIGTLGAASRTLSAMFVFRVSAQLAKISRACAARTSSYVARLSMSPVTTDTPASCRRAATAGSGSITT